MAYVRAAIAAGILAAAAVGLAGCGGNTAPMSSVKPLVTACKTIAAGYHTGALPDGPGAFGDPGTAYDVLVNHVDLAVSLPRPQIDSQAQLTAWADKMTAWNTLDQTVNGITARLGTAGGGGLEAGEASQLRAACAPAGVTLPAG